VWRIKFNMLYCNRMKTSFFYVVLGVLSLECIIAPLAQVNAAGFADGKILYVDDFSDNAILPARYEELLGSSHGEDICEVIYENGAAILKAPLNGVTQIRTRDSRAVIDDGKKPVLYSVREGAIPGTTCVYNALWVRLEEGLFDTGYEIVRYFDGKSTILSIVQHKNKTAKILYASKNPQDTPALVENEIPEFANYKSENLLEVCLENQENAVKITVFYNGVALKTLLDDSPDRITEGSGVGLKFRNNGVDKLIGGRFSDLKVVQAP
jgi:hypothetical protein